METKTCNKCNDEKEIIHFHKKSNSHDGYNTICIECISKQKKEYYYNNKSLIKERQKDYSKQYYVNNKVEIKEHRNKYYSENKDVFANYYIENRDKILEDQKKYREENKESIKKTKQEYLKNNPEKIADYRKKYYDENKDVILANNRAWNNKNAHIVAWRSVLKSHLRRIGKKKEGHTIDLLGYSALELKEHIEALFVDGMYWDNHGVWEIDHVMPVTSFDSETLPNVVNALSNLQPLWRADNRSKYNNY